MLSRERFHFSFYSLLFATRPQKAILIRELSGRDARLNEPISALCRNLSGDSMSIYIGTYIIYILI